MALGRIRFPRALLILAAFSTLPAMSLFALTGTEAGPDVVALVVPLDPDAEDFGSVVAGALELGFNPAGLILDVRTLHLSGSAQPDDDTLRRRVGATAAGAILICRFSIVDKEMTASMDWQDVPKGIHASVSGSKAQVDLSLDAFIRHVLDGLLAPVRGRIDEMAAKRRDASAAAATQALPGAGRHEPFPAVSERPTTEDGTSARRFLLSTGIAPFIPVGAASSYFSLGYMYTAAGNLVFPIPSGRIGVGISFGVVSFTAEGAPGTSTSFLVPLGLDASYRLGESSMAGLLFHLTGGAAVFFMSSPTLGTKAKTVPFLRGAVGVELLVSRTVGVLLDAGYEIYFEMPLLIMGVSPALEISLRL
jgi:hypothetical protein